MRYPGRHIWVGSLLLLCLLAGCGPSHPVSSHRFDDGFWALSDSVVLSWSLQDTSLLNHPGSLRLGLVVAEDYPYQNMWVRIRVQPPTGPASERNLQLMLMDAAGNWYGEPEGGSHRVETSLTDSLRLGQPGQWRFTLKQWMRTDTLQAVEEISLAFRPRQQEP
jgi:gliding motility-associated lipoprotein GldH